MELFARGKLQNRAIGNEVIGVDISNIIFGGFALDPQYLFLTLAVFAVYFSAFRVILVAMSRSTPACRKSV